MYFSKNLNWICHVYIIGLIRQPKYGHLKDLHNAVKRCEKALLNADPTIKSLGSYEQVCQILRRISQEKSTPFMKEHLYKPEKKKRINNLESLRPKILHIGNSLLAETTVAQLHIFQAYVFSSKLGGCAAFLSNYNPKAVARVTFNNKQYMLPPWSISILPDCKNVIFNTAKVSDVDIHSSYYRVLI